MRGLRIPGFLVLTLMLVLLTTSARFSNQITGLDSATFEGRDVLVIRTSAAVATPNGFSRDPGQSTVTFRLTGVGADEIGAENIQMSLLREVSFIPVSGKGTDVVVRLASPELVDSWLFRLNQPSEHLILFEVFPGKDEQRGARLISDIEGQLGITPAPARQPIGIPAAPVAEFNPDEMGIPTIDLSMVDAQQVLALAARSGLLDTRKPASVTTEGMGTLVVEPGGLSVASWSPETPPGELYLSGTPEQIASFMGNADPTALSMGPGFVDIWARSQPSIRTSSGPSPATRSRMRDDPYAGLYYSETQPGSGSFLSDIRVSLPAMDGLDLYDVINYLSLISGISIIIDPYTFDEPTGMRRQPLPPNSDGQNNSGPGFRPAGIFDPQFAGSGTVRGNFIDVPFDTALNLILDTHGLEFVVYDGDGGGNTKSGQLGTRDSRNGGGADPYAKPIVLVTSRERLEQEISGSNEVNLQQFHYADPFEISNILDNMNMLPSTTQGWYIYNGGGGFGGGNGGGGGFGGGNGGGGNNSRSTAKGGLLVYRGSTRTPVYEAVGNAVADGDSVVRILLAPERGSQYVTAFSRI